ncbi:MAG: 16S rRNA (guanine(527)-N(7))-methyltransferase RsmG [Sphingomonas sp.]|nr:16S rRNA (guanine(527)-N(7))-methyltransferase RsmG [Sphingomonas sp.]OQW45568.1 MAG: 16S rRNA (guanine(527)-N(7))-methyltransferase RsmG [Proteobacteria bacterium SG_bin6]
MTEDEARAWFRARYVSRETAVVDFAALVAEEQARQNLVSSATLPLIWSRHIVDSAQLLDHVPAEGLWADIGSGAGFPGMIVALLTDRPVALIEPRRKRAEFLAYAAEALGLADRVTVHAAKAEALALEAAVVSARAVASLPDLLALSTPLSTAKTRFVFPKGRSAREEVAAARRAWHGVFHVEPSITDPESLIILARGVARR